VPAIGLILGCALLCLSFSIASTRAPGELEFALFWLGILAGIVPIGIRLVRAQTGRTERIVLLVAAALFAFVPKFLRDPTSPLFHDELIHVRQAQNVFQVGHPFVSSSLTAIIKSYPGLEELTASVQNLTGLSTFEVATALLWLLHVVTLIGVFVLVERITASSRAAGVGALLYSINPAFMFFDAQFSYESLSIVYAVWILVCVVGFQKTGAGAHRSAWFVLALVLGAACIVTHHVTSYALVVVLLAVSVALFVLRNRGPRATAGLRLTWIYTGGFALGVGAWLVFVAPTTLDYVAPHVLPTLGNLFNALNRSRSSPKYFAPSVVPAYEQAAAVVAIVVLAVFSVSAWMMLLRRRKMTPTLLAFAAFGMLYFASVPVLLTSEGEAATRSWAYTYIGLAVLLGGWAGMSFSRLDRSTTGRFGLAAATSAALAVIVVGNVHVQATYAYRFPGPYIYGSDTRSLTPELIATAGWLHSRIGSAQPVLADRDTGIAIGTLGDDSVAQPSPGFPAWDIYFSSALPTDRLLQELRTSGYRYMVVETDMYRLLPVTGFYFNLDEPEAGKRTQPPPEAALDKFDGLPWMSEIYSTQNLRIYHLDFSQLQACPAAPRVASSLVPGCSP
jgi:hypothetical protein